MARVDAKSARLKRWVLIALGSIAVAAVAFFSWRSSPHLAEIRWLPPFLGAWADAHPNLRTALPFAGLAGLSGLLLSSRLPRLCWLFAWVLLLCLTEFGQMLLPQRTFDWEDLAWGAAGLLLVFVLIEWVRLLARARATH